MLNKFLGPDLPYYNLKKLTLYLNYFDNWSEKWLKKFCFYTSFGANYESFISFESLNSHLFKVNDVSLNGGFIKFY